MSTLMAPPQKGVRSRMTTATEFEVRKLPDGMVGVRGYASVYDQVAHGEVVRRGAFDKTVAEQDDVRFLTNHAGVPWARTKSGTGVLTLDNTGLLAEAPRLDAANPTVAELVSALDRGDIDQMSFAFTPVRITEVTDDAGEVVYELAEVRLWDVSVVTYPWYDETSVELDLARALRSLHNGEILSAEQRALIAERAGLGLEPAPVTESEPTPVLRSLLNIDKLYS